MLLTTVLALAAIVGQGIVCVLLLRFVKSFGAYAEDYRKMTTALLATHETNLLLHQEHKRILEVMQEFKPPVKGVA